MKAYVETKKAGQCGGWNNSWSERRKVELKLDLDDIRRGKGYWKLNYSYLNEEEYVKQIKHTLSKAIWELQIAEATDNPERHTLTSIENMTPNERSLIKVQMNPTNCLSGFSSIIEKYLKHTRGEGGPMSWDSNKKLGRNNQASRDC